MLDEGLGCRISGTVDVPKVPGKFILMTSDVQNLFLSLATGGDEKAREAFKKFSFDHFFFSLSFGDMEQREQIKASFSEFPEHIKFDMVREDYSN